MNGYVREGISSAEELRRELVQAVHEIRRRIAARGTVFRQARAALSQPLPQVAGPRGEA